VHKGKLRWLNITEYVRLGYSNFIPEGKVLNEKRPLIWKRVQQMIDIFGIEFGMVHPEWFLTDEDVLSFGETACRIPGGHILELCSKAYGFDALAAFVMSHDPNMSEEEFDAMFPDKDYRPEEFYGNVMIYPQKSRIEKLEMPEMLENEPYFLDHSLIPPLTSQKIDSREGYGNHFGTVNFKGEDPERMKELLLEYEKVDFYV
jgi:hypothetical protein